MAATSGTSLNRNVPGEGLWGRDCHPEVKCLPSMHKTTVPLQNEQEHTDLATRIFEDVRMPQPVCSLDVLVLRAVTQHLSFMDSVFLRLEALCWNLVGEKPSESDSWAGIENWDLKAPSTAVLLWPPTLSLPCRHPMSPALQLALGHTARINLFLVSISLCRHRASCSSLC